MEHNLLMQTAVPSYIHMLMRIKSGSMFVTLVEIGTIVLHKIFN